MTDEELIETFWKVRDAQSAYFAAKRANTPDWQSKLDEARSLERAVDAERKRRNKPKGKTLFDTLDEWDEPATERQLRATGE